MISRMFGVLAGFAITINAWGQLSATPKLGEELNQANKRIVEILRDEGPAQGAKEIEELRTTWWAKSPSACADLVNQACRGLAKSKEQPPGVDLANVLARETLIQGDAVPAAYAFRLSLYVLPLKNGDDQGTIIKDRAEAASILLSVWKRCGDELDPKFDPNIRPPSGASVSMFFNDPKLQTESEAQRAAGEKYADYYAKQENLRDILNEYSSTWKRNLVLMYSSGPDDAEALKTALTKYVADETVRDSILAEVQRNWASPATTKPAGK